MTSRRSFILGLTSLLAAPAIVKADSLMPLWVPKQRIITMEELLGQRIAAASARLALDLEGAWYSGYSYLRNDPADFGLSDIIPKAQFDFVRQVVTVEL